VTERVCARASQPSQLHSVRSRCKPAVRSRCKPAVRSRCTAVTFMVRFWCSGWRSRIVSVRRRSGARRSAEPGADDLLQTNERDADPDLVSALLAPPRRRRAPSFAVAKARRERSEFVSDQRWGLVAPAVVVMAAVALIAVSGRSFVSGLVIGAALASLGWVTYLVLAIRSYNAFIGAKAERWTARMLKSAPDGWRCIPNVGFEKYDVDYVVLTADAVLAIEVKWRPYLSPKDQVSRHRADLEQAMFSQRKMHSFLRSCHLADLPVVPVLLLWGPGTPDMSGGRAIEGTVHVLDGTEFKTWRDHYVTGGRLLTSIDALEEALSRHIKMMEHSRVA
jgi:hypothetical protein